MPGQSIEQFPLRLIGGEVSGQGGFGRILTQLFQMGLIVLHGAPVTLPTKRIRASNRKSSAEKINLSSAIRLDLVSATDPFCIF
jgi:hypothetical protein